MEFGREFGKDFGVGARRKRLKKSGDEAAAAAGVPRATWYAWEAGRSLTLLSVGESQANWLVMG